MLSPPQKDNPSSKRKILSSTTSLNYRRIDCTILEGGLNAVMEDFYLCECDPERRNPICKKCFKTCHKGPGHMEIKHFHQECVCVCGFNAHQPMDKEQGKKSDEKYSKKCLFGEWASECKYNIFFKDPNENSFYVCLLCKNLCYKNARNLIKTSTDSEGISSKNFVCQCNNQNHANIRVLFRKFKSISKKNNFNKKYDFEGFTFTQLVNIILKGKQSFDNIFHSFEDKINETIGKIKTNPTYALEEHSFLNDLHFTSNILSNYAIKTKNVFILIKKEKDGKNNDKVDLLSITEKSKDERNISNTYYIYGKNLVYFRDEIKNILTPSKYFLIMMKKFDYKSNYIWQLKQFLTNIFYSFRVAKDFVKFPNIKYRDIMLLNPIQRLTLVSNIKKSDEINEQYLSSEENILDNVIQCLLKIAKTNEKQGQIYFIYSKLYKICEIYAKYSLFNYEQVNKFCSVNNKILFSFGSCVKDDRKNIEQQNLKFKVLSPMMKCILYLAYYYNDQVLASYLKQERNLKNVNFFHMKTEICKLLMKNVINCLTLIQEFIPDFDFEDLKEMDESKDSDSPQRKKRNISKVKSVLEKEDVIKVAFEGSNMKRCLRNIVKCSYTIIKLVVGFPESYMTGIYRLTNKYEEYAFYYYDSGKMTLNEIELVKKLTQYFEQLESNYFKHHTNFKKNSDEIINQINDILTQVLKSLNINEEKKDNIVIPSVDEGKSLIENRSKIKSTYNNTKKINYDEEVYKFYIEREKPIRYKTNVELNEEDKLKILINKTYVLQSIFKSINIFHSFSVSNNSKNLFFMDDEIFHKILKLSYFYINNNLDNCFMFLTSDFLSNIEFLNGEQLFNMLDLVEHCLKTIYLYSAEIQVDSQLIHLLKVSIVKSSNSICLIDKILKIMQIIVKINFIEEQNTVRKMRKLMIFFYSKLTEANIDLKTLLNGKDKIRNYKTLKKTLRVLNKLFEGNAVLEERRFIEDILTKREILKILKKNFTLDISIRTELLIFYRIVYLDTIILERNINYYTSLLIIDPQVAKVEGNIENQKYLRFFENLMVSGNNPKTIEVPEEARILIFELRNFRGIIESRAQHNNLEKTRYFIEYGLIKCILVFMNKLSSYVFNWSGANYLLFYLLMHYFLCLKKYIMEHQEMFIDKSDRKTFKNPFKNKLASWGKKHKHLISFTYSEEEMKRVQEDYFKTFSRSYEVYNFSDMNNLLHSHCQNFIVEQKLNKGMKDFFEKKSEIFEEEEIEKKKEYLSSMNLMESQFQENVFDVVIKYYNDKTKIEKSTFFKVLSEDNIYYNCNYRFLLIKNILFLMSNFQYEASYRDYCMWSLFRLLQYDTSMTQKACLELLEKKNY